mmetsp:Transcript_64202/g.130680  ORF Transcript_64202/g.130680 Transcript_64202/m.130680 type:complete len:310 (-) Transcript_64202:327-1256(-)
MTDEVKKKTQQEDDQAILRSMSGNWFSNASGESPGTIAEKSTKNNALDKDNSDSYDGDQPKEELLGKNDRAVNHDDLFRSDRGGAAINSGEEGFDEEMGGQTQAAYEVYENVRDELCEEADLEENSGVVDDNTDGNHKNEDHGFHDGKDQSMLPILQVQPENYKSNDDAKTEYLDNLIIASRRSSPLRATVRDDIHNSKSEALTGSIENSNPSNVGSSSNIIEQFNNQQKLDLTTDANEGDNASRNPSVKKTPVNIMSTSIQTKNKVLLMGCTDISNAKTTFSAADFPRPDYGRKNKKNKKKKRKKSSK